jgi:cation:H+ antiporter
VGDGHICIPLCVGIYALLKEMPVPPFFQLGMLLLAGATLVHFLFVALLGRLPRFMGLVLIISYGYFVIQGLLR